LESIFFSTADILELNQKLFLIAKKKNQEPSRIANMAKKSVINRTNVKIKDFDARLIRFELTLE
jgi:hypothetical protein